MGKPPSESWFRVRADEDFVFDTYLLVIPADWQIAPRGLSDLAGRPWVAGPPGTACDHALRRLATENRGLLMASVSTLAVLLLLVDMIWKPGA